MARPKRISSVKFATRAEVEKAAVHWTDQALGCRINGHSWRQDVGEHILRYFYWHVVYICKNKCGVKKWQEWDEEGNVTASVMVYPKDKNGNHLYLMDGLGRVSGAARGALRLESVARAGFTEITGGKKDDDDESDRPHSSRTVKRLEEQGKWPSS